MAEILDITIQSLESYLPKFEQAYQEEKWVETYVQMIKVAVASGELDELRANPIPLNYINRYSKRLAYIIAELRYAVLNMHDVKKAIESAIEVISRVFMFEIADRMNNISPEAPRPSTTDPVEIQKFMNENVMNGIRLRNRPEVAEVEVRLWLGLADEIQRRLENR